MRHKTSHGVTIRKPQMHPATRDVMFWPFAGIIPGMSRSPPEPDFMRAAGLRLRAVREALDKTQDQMAEEIGVERNAYANWEGGTRTPQVAAMVRLLRVQRISLDWIYAGVFGALPGDLQPRIFAAANAIGAPLGGDSVPIGLPERPTARGRPTKASRFQLHEGQAPSPSDKWPNVT
jgi:transcriptional regulator with XRE-family HTH domain